MGSLRAIFKNVICLSLITAGLLAACAVTVEANPDLTSVIKAEQSQTATASRTIVPTQDTLYDQEAGEIVSLLYGDDCDLSCLWGIRPGRSTAQDIADLFERLGTYGYVFGYPSDQRYASVDLKFDGENVYLAMEYEVSDEGDRVSAVHSRSFLNLFNSDPRRSFQGTYYSYLMGKWEMAPILETYGPPDQIVMYLENNIAEFNAPDFFDTWFLYPEHGAIIRYEAGAETTRRGEGEFLDRPEYAYVCPTDALIEIWIIEEKGSEALNNKLSELLLGWTSYEELHERYKTVNEVLGLSIEEFSDSIIKGQKNCFDTPVEGWPGPY